MWTKLRCHVTLKRYWLNTTRGAFWRFLKSGKVVLFFVSVFLHRHQSVILIFLSVGDGVYSLKTETDFGVFWRPQNAPFCTYTTKSEGGGTICTSVPLLQILGGTCPPALPSPPWSTPMAVALVFGLMTVILPDTRRAADVKTEGRHSERMDLFTNNTTGKGCRVQTVDTSNRALCI